MGEIAEKINIGGQDLTVEKVVALLWRYKKALEGLTVGGSEFVNDPERCAAYIRERFESERKFGRVLGYKQAIEDAAQSLETLSKGDMPTDRQIGLRIGAAAIRALAPEGGEKKGFD